MKPTREFTADEGDLSVSLAGPDAIEKDLDNINRMFDPNTFHTDGSKGGIAEENIQDDAITDKLIGSRTIDDSILDEYVNTGEISKLVSFIAKSLKLLKGTSVWSEETNDTINGLDMRVKGNTDEIERHVGSQDHDNRYYTEVELDNGILNSLYYTKNQISPFLAGGVAPVYTDKFTIINADNGDGTFSYLYNGIEYLGELINGDTQVFAIEGNTYQMGTNSLLVYLNGAIINDIENSQIIEIAPNKFGVTPIRDAGVIVIIKYMNVAGVIAVDNILYQVEQNSIYLDEFKKIAAVHLPMEAEQYNKVAQWADMLIPDTDRGNALLEFLLTNEESSEQITGSEQAMLVIMEENRFDKNRQAPFDYDQIIFKLGSKTEVGQYLAWIEELCADHKRGVEKLELGLMLKNGSSEISNNHYAMNVIMKGEQMDGLVDYRRKFADKIFVDGEIARLDIRIDGVV